MMTEKTVKEIELLKITHNELVFADMSTLKQISNTEYAIQGHCNNLSCSIRFHVTEGRKTAMMIKHEGDSSTNREQSIVVGWTNSDRCFKICHLFDDSEFKATVIKQLYGIEVEFKKDHIDKDGELWSSEDCENSGFFVAVDYEEKSYPSSHVGITGLRTPIDVKYESDEVEFETIIDADTLEVVSKFEKY